MNDIERFSFFKTYADTIERFNNVESKKELLLAIYEYMYFDKKPKFSNKEKALKEMAWVGLEAILKISKNKAKNAKKK